MMNKEMLSRIMKFANRLASQGYDRSESMKMAWELAKSETIETRVAGTAIVPLRQKALEHLTRYSENLVNFSIVAETDNAYDANAVAVYATVYNKGSFKIGYLPRELANTCRCYLDRGCEKSVSGFVVGGGIGYNYGCRLNIRLSV